MNVVKKMFGGICIFICICEIAAGIYQITQSKDMQDVIGFILASLFFGVLAFFLLKPSKKAKTANFNPSSNKHAVKNSSEYQKAQTNPQPNTQTNPQPNTQTRVKTNYYTYINPSDDVVQKIFKQVGITVQSAAQAKAAEQAKSEQTAKQQAASIVDEIEKLNQLLYSGLITQEEFDAKKKQLLGL